ncbi:HesA/MoeB/ThiF family protein [Hyphomonas jannaschiana]|uniref:Dinucleotide-utilizing enzyme possibly involved in molybdopterin or thiamin biosynthesis n=1 Tax=Hyphomonas jannaschiana VP2 TaxID=1280952 RepID=A0A059FHT0_9PROT|nr:ThiF family adenylyltransferase [Hyphomonas jannaschiana]KCZ90215.1 dinucleotide-utilizing enzyme possibly involved in molybdopterin or thiamin biosynthesis [Hyphomonas jannaschiana VP2]
MSAETARQDLVNCLRRAGFVARPTPSHIDFTGTLKVRGQILDAVLRFDNADFTEAPQLLLPNPSLLGRFVVPHLDEKGELCVFDRRRYLFDPYRAAACCLGILQKAATDLEKNCGEAAEAEIARELPQHFGGKTVSTSFGTHEGPLSVITDRTRVDTRLEPLSGKPARAGAFAMSSSSELSFTSDQDRPSTLGEFLDWVDYWDPGLAARILTQLSKSVTGKLDLIGMVCAANGQVGFQIQPEALPPAQKQVYAQMSWGKLAALQQIRGWPIKRLQGRRSDLAYILSRNGGDMGPLSGRNVLLVGCGAIGGYVALSLSQLGAGAGIGSLTLVDPDILRATNTSRHILGANEVGRWKADSIKKHIDEHLPGLNTVAVSRAVETLEDHILSYDLIVDATGEHHVGEWLNRHALKQGDGSQPKLFHAWIEGQGAAVRSFLNAAPGLGCFRCLQTDLESGKSRYWVLKPEAVVETVQPCGDDAFIPYGPSAPMAAAALLSAHVTDWASGKPVKHLLTQQLDFEVTRQVKPATPTRLETCPACGNAP